MNNKQSIIFDENIHIIKEMGQIYVRWDDVEKMIKVAENYQISQNYKFLINNVSKN